MLKIRSFFSFFYRKDIRKTKFRMMRKLIAILTLLTTVSFAADFERSNWRTQLYLQAEPAFLNFKVDKSKTLMNQSIDRDVLTFPLAFGALWSPLITPAWKADIPFTLWLGVEVNSFQFGSIVKHPDYTPNNAGGSSTVNPRDNEELSFMAYAPSALAGFTFNLIGDLDMRVLGGFGFQFFSFYDEYGGNTEQHTEMAKTGFVSGALEYRITEVFRDVDLKVGVNVRKEFLPYEDIKARKKDNSEGVKSPYSDLKFEEISYKWPVRVGIELSLDFGRESRRDRRMRYNLHDRDDVLRKYSEVKDTLTDWDCMAIERDYRFYLDEDGNLPDMSEAYTRTQFADVLESFLAFCHPADLATKEQLYATLDSGKVQIKEYQAKQEDSRFDQVMASNDPEMLEMFLQYYPDSPRRAEVETKLRSLGEYDKFRAIQAQNTFKAYLTYLNDNPNGAFRDEAEAGIFELVKAGNRLKDYEIYLKRFPNGKYAEEAKAALQQANSQENSIIEYQTGETYSEPAPQAEEEPAAVEEGEDDEEEVVAKPAKNKKAAKKSNKKASKKQNKKAKSKKKK